MASRKVRSSVVMDPAIVGLGGLLRQYHLRVPQYQRNYAWGNDEVREYLDDITNAQSDKPIDYFFGTVVLAQRSDNTLEVIDGQQRLATTYMLISAVRNSLSALGATDDADDLDKTFLNSLNLSKGKRSPKLVLNVDDNALFVQTLATPQPAVSTGPRKQSAGIRPEGASNRKLVAAWTAIQAFVSESVKGEARAAKDLLTLVGFLDKNARVIRLIVPDEISAYTVFETLNDRGVELAVADLLKNYLYSRSGKYFDEVSAAWNQMTGKLNHLKERDIIVQFVSHFWASSHGLTRRRDLLAQAKKSIDSPDGARTIAIELRSNADTYLAIVDPHAQRWKGTSKDRADCIRVLSQVLRIVQIRPLLLSIADVWRAGEQVKAFRLLVNCAVRVLVAGARGGTIERLYNDTAARVRKGKIRNTVDLRDAMRSLVPADDRFREEFGAMRVSRDELARYYLVALERAAETSSIRDDDPKITLEHVLPEQLSASEWPGISQEQHRSYRYSIGNLCLLAEKANSKLGNAAFAKKKTVYSHSSITLTKEIAGYENGIQIRLKKGQMPSQNSRLWLGLSMQFCDRVNATISKVCKAAAF
jgi:hypothetical protein